MTMASKTMGQGLAAVYGRAHDSVTGLYAVMGSGERVAWPIHYDPRNQERYFAVIADCEQLKDIVAVAGRRRTSLKKTSGSGSALPREKVSLPPVPGETAQLPQHRRRRR